MEETIALDSIQQIAANFGASFDAEKIVDTVLEKDGTRYYKVRWVKYSWEPAASFAHLEHLIRDFWSQLGQNSNGLEDLTEKQDVNKQISESLAQVLAAESSEANRTSIPSVLTPTSNITCNVVDVHSEENFHLQQNLQLSTTFPQLSNVGTGNANIVSPTEQIAMHKQEKPSSEVDIPAIAPTLRQTRGKKSCVPEESKKRRKIPGNCSICGKHFKSTTNIAAHKKLHTEERQYECDVCGRKFRRKLHLVRHRESHAGIKNYECHICGSFFSSKWYMQAHAVIHTGDKPYQCDICQKSFNNKANLNKHKLIHANNRPFVCNECGRTYRQSYDLKRHMSTHSEIKNFTCVTCEKSFARKTYLQRHLLTHSGDKKYSCHICFKKFFQRGHLNFHVKQQHVKSKQILEENNSEPRFSVERGNDLLNEDNSKANENEVVNLKKQMLHKPSKGLNQQTVFDAAPNNINGEALVFLAITRSDYNNSDNTQVISSKQIYQETLTAPQHNLSLNGNTSIPQKCLIIAASNLTEKHGIVLENCESKNVRLDNTVADNGNGSNDMLVHIEQDKQEIETRDSHHPSRIESIHQSEQDVAISVLTNEQTETYFTEQGVLGISKDEHVFMINV